MKRKIDNALLDWKNSVARKVLLVRGARQVGKTYSVRNLAATFDHFIEINFELDRELIPLFENSLNPQDLCEKISAFFDVPIIQGKTLLFFDEIQACPDALSALRFFYEKMPRLHVVAAGSLLEFALSEIPSFGVGRIESLFMYPMSFNEFLMALGKDGLIKLKTAANQDKALDDLFHKELINYLKTFYMIGGMPDVVSEYVNSRNISLCQKKLSSLIESLRDDFAKYKQRVPTAVLNEVFDSVAYQCGGKFKYSKIDSAASQYFLKMALDLLIKSGLAYKIYHTSAQGSPLGAQIKQNKFKVLLFDVGIYQRMKGLNIEDMIIAQDFDSINKGNIAELFFGLDYISESISYKRPELYYWHKESRVGNAEVDYIIAKGQDIFPVEVKSSSTGKMQSMRVFLKDHCHVSRGIRCSLENFSCFNNILVLPLYSVSSLFE